MWWGGPLENGWGLNLVQQDDIVFGVWYTYGPDGRPTWYVMPNIGPFDQYHFGLLYRTSGSAWLGATYDPGKHNITSVGGTDFIFHSDGSATFGYSFSSGPFAGPRQFRTIVRLSY